MFHILERISFLFAPPRPCGKTKTPLPSSGSGVEKISFELLYNRPATLLSSRASNDSSRLVKPQFISSYHLPVFLTVVNTLSFGTTPAHLPNRCHIVRSCRVNPVLALFHSMRSVPAIWLLSFFLLFAGCKDEEAEKTIVVRQRVVRRGEFPPPTPPPDRGGYAPANVNNYDLRLVSGSSAREIGLWSDGNYRELIDIQLYVAPFTYARAVGGASATLTLQEPAGPVTVQLSFTGTGTGNFTYSAGRGGSGSFTLQSSLSPGDVVTVPIFDEPHPDQPRPPTPIPPTTGVVVIMPPVVERPVPVIRSETETPSDPQPAGARQITPLKLDGLTFVVHWTDSIDPSGDLVSYDFSQTAFREFIGPSVAGGSYSYSSAEHLASVILTYTSPSDLHGENRQLQLTFTENGRGTVWAETTRESGLIVSSGTFEIP